MANPPIAITASAPTAIAPEVAPCAFLRPAGLPGGSVGVAFAPEKHNMTESVIKMALRCTRNYVVDYFEPYEYYSQLTSNLRPRPSAKLKGPTVSSWPDGFFVPA
jgi:hypothetical protein